MAAPQDLAYTGSSERIGIDPRSSAKVVVAPQDSSSPAATQQADSHSSSVVPPLDVRPAIQEALGDSGNGKYEDASTIKTQAHLPPLARDNWADDLPQTEHLRLFRETQWEKTHLGPLAQWSLGLRMHVFTVFSDSRSSCIYWGKNKTAIYNSHFALLAGRVHPGLMGNTFRSAFPELIDSIEPEFDKAWESGVSSELFEVPLVVIRNGYKEETYFTGNFVPIRDSDGAVGGFYNSTMEVTKQKVLERRSAMLSELVVPSKPSTGNLASFVMGALEHNPVDITMALLYEVDEETIPNVCRVMLKGSIGVPVGHALLVNDEDLESSRGLIPYLKRAGTNILTLPVDEKFEGIDWRGHKEPSSHFNIIPLAVAERIYGYLVLGANPFKLIDELHGEFMISIAAKVSAIAASITSAELNKKRAERLDRELVDSERQIRYMAQHAPVGMQHMSLDGKVIWANDYYYELVGQDRDAPDYEFAFSEVFVDEDHEKAIAAWVRLRSGEANVSVELRLRRQFTPPFGEPEPACILSRAFPYIEDGKVKSIMCCTTDVSQLKWAEQFEARKAADAQEAKNQQEEFIDLISHEMRNPLSAIFQCADAIQTSLSSCEEQDHNSSTLLEALKSNAEAADTILMCAKHQKRIVDDVLTLSKLEYMMLSVSPRPIQPAVFIERTVRIFDADVQSHRIKLEIATMPSFLGSDIWMMCDPSRVAQIIINLFTNAIKFTRDEPRREIIIKYGMSLDRPRDMFPSDINWALTSNTPSPDLTLDKEWGDGEIVYLSISISDTGCGMNFNEIKKLFSRFRQANLRTSIKYSGSGLGLFISQKLCQKQGGEIGVSSKPGEGSTFVFYVKTRRAAASAVAFALQAPGAAMLHSASDPKSPATDVVKIAPKDMHVLLVEDNVVNQKVLSKQLRRYGCVVHIANHGVEALDFIRTSDIWYERTEGSAHLDIILMDWEMSVMDGLTCSREIRRLEEERKVVRRVGIVATTANAREEQTQLALASGIDSVMTKPFIASALLNRMKEVLETASSKG